MHRARWTLPSTLVLLVLLGAVRAEEPASGDARGHLDAAERLMGREQYDAARREYEQALEADRGSVPAWRGLGWSFWRLGQKERAFQTWNDLLKVLPREGSVLLAIAQAQEQDHQWDRALESYARVLEVDSAQDAAREARARILRYLGDQRQEHGEAAQAILFYERSLRERPMHRGTVRVLANLYQDEQRFADAAALLRGYVAANDNDDEMREKLAQEAALAGNLAEAERQWGQLIRRHPKDVRWQISLARMLHKAGRTAESTKIADEILRAQPDNADALTILTDDALYGGGGDRAIALLERFSRAAPSAPRMNELGELHLERGRRLEEQDDEKAAKREYASAASAFERSSEIDPKDADARLGRITALRLQGKVDEAIRLAEELHQQYPSLERASRELYDANLQAGRYDRASLFFEDLRRNFPSSFRLQREGAFLTFARGNRQQAIDDLRRMLESDLRPNVPVLLYHGITVSPAENATPVEHFRDQIAALKKSGYQTITIAELMAFLDGKGSLPPKPVLITFDDARTDSFQNADPILKDAGYVATMFIPAAEIDRKISFYATWKTLREIQKTGRWDMQCHGFLAHRLVAVDGDGNKGRFLANRAWKADEGRLETESEFVDRLDGDYAQCKDALSRELPGSHVISYAYPFDDPGWKTLSNEPQAFAVNQRLLSRHYALGFIVEPPGFVTRSMPQGLLPRFEVPREYGGEDLLRHLRIQEPRVSTLLRIAEFYAYSGRYTEALATYALLEREDVDRATLYEGKGKVLGWRGDTAAARELIEAAHQLRPDDEKLAERLDEIESRFRPQARFAANVYRDNRDRSSVRFGPSGELHLTDRIALSPSYQHLELVNRGFDPRRLDPQPSPPGAGDAPAAGQPQDGGSSGTSASAQASSDGSDASMPAPAQRTRLDAVGDQFLVQLDYAHDWHSGFSIAAGAAQFRDRSSSPRVFGGSQTFALGSAQGSFGYGDALDVSLGASRDFVGTAGAILDGLGVSSSLARLRLRPLDRVTLSAQHSFSGYDDGNTRNTVVGQALYQLFGTPLLLVGYQFLFDDTRRDSDLFYTPHEFRAHEAVLSLQAKVHRRLRGYASFAAGVGQERGGNPEFEASLSAGTELSLGDHVGVFVQGERSQAARFESIAIGGGANVRF